MFSMLKRSFTIVLFLVLININYCQQLVYKPINPSFALGETFNASWLLSSAQAQNDINEATKSASYKRDALEEFSTSLQRSILSQLSRRILDDTFGEDIKEGVFEFDTFNIEITNVSEGMSVRIFDTSTGNETEIVIPYF